MAASVEFRAAWHAETERLRGLQRDDPAAGLGRGPLPGDTHVAPARRGGALAPHLAKPWEGLVARKPWEYRVTAAIVHLDTPDLLAAVVATLRAQTVRPYLLVVDAGSLPEHREVLRRWDRESVDLELIELNPKAWRMTSEPVAVGMDCASARCQTEYLYATHTDVFLKRPDYLEYLLTLCGPDSPAVGHQMSPRTDVWPDDGWARILSHTATLYHVPTLLRAKARWSMSATYARYGREPRQPGAAPDPALPVYPDTEVELGLCLRDAGFGFRWVTDPPSGPAVVALAPESNDVYENEWLEHVRSATSHILYAPARHEANRARLDSAVRRAQDRAAAWSGAPAPAGPGPGPGPGLLRKAAHLAGAVAAHVAGGMHSLSPEDVAARLAVCAACPHFTAWRSCNLCGCHLDWKASWPEQHCPLKKWPGDERT